MAWTGGEIKGHGTAVQLKQMDHGSGVEAAWLIMTWCFLMPLSSGNATHMDKQSIGQINMPPSPSNPLPGSRP